MFGAIQKMFRQLGGSPAEESFAEDDPRIAAAALAVHAIAIDGEVDEEERRKLRAVLSEQYHLDDEETEALIKEARRRDLEAVDLYTFTSVLKRSLDEEQRVEIVEMLWRLVYADGQVHEFEDNLVWRVAELLGVSARDRMLLRKQVTDE
ncbi:TerB family tellurite resistance protein [Lutibaculum baratangense]|uniref:Co-chaperone DjlA N-terminal domain-containing protein n=1 Tax=Lutibaculum baratangense AMV1 TaxID=631454 RepID=V4RL08_9HYPH|nr:TerB family tellurite resistance protein [Lutibaculum baratangense]ESR23895.1 hypothetical protein N177_2840 [Lutibaculum baratangense AMV1]